MNRLIFVAISIAFLFTGACTPRMEIIPDLLERKVDRNLRYSDIKDDPEAYRGKLMVTGGKVLSAKRTQSGTRIEVLQIPLSKGLLPAAREYESKGRFVIIDRGDQVSDPAIFDEDKRITLVGEVLGMTTVTIDDVQQQVPQLAITHMTVWDWDRMKGRYGPYYGYGYPYVWAYHGYPLYW